MTQGGVDQAFLLLIVPATSYVPKRIQLDYVPVSRHVLPRFLFCALLFDPLPGHFVHTQHLSFPRFNPLPVDLDVRTRL